MKKALIACAILVAAFLFGCQNQKTGNMLDAADVESVLPEKLITALNGDVIQLPEGTFTFNRSLSLEGLSDITIKGAGKGKTVLSFKDQVEGAQGLLVMNVDGLTLEGFTIRDTKGDAIKVQASRKVTFRNMEATWTGGASPENGGYGLYPVDCTDVLIEDCEASFASDAGIYVGQSNDVVVRNNYAHHNVAGIEIENTRNADVYGNTAKENTGGLLIFDMPDLPQPNGWKIRVHNNLVEDNNHANFASPGTVVSTLPPGSGMILMAHKEVEIFGNTIRQHASVGLSMISWMFTGRPFESDQYDPFCSAVYIHDNLFADNTGQVDTTTQFGQLIAAVNQGQTVDIATDGIFNPATLGDNGVPTGTNRICIRNNGDVRFLNLNAGKGSLPQEIVENMNTDATVFDCEGPAVQAAEH